MAKMSNVKCIGEGFTRHIKAKETVTFKRPESL